MKPVYEIKFLSSKDFDKLPVAETAGSDISDSLGFYNPHTNRVFIRHTAIPELDKYLLEHEFEHLLEEHPTDADENGIRHKKKKGFASIFNFLPAVRAINAAKSGDVTDLVHPFAQNTVKGAMKPGDQPEQQQMSSFGGLNYGSNSGGTPTFGSSQSPFGDQASSQGGLNQGLNSQSINPLSSDPYAQYGRQAGRMYF